MARPAVDPTATPTADRVLAAASRTFAARGFGPATLADIARDAGITRPSLLYWYATKEALYDAVVRAALGALAEALWSQRDTRGSFDERLQGMYAAFVGFVEGRPEVAGIVVRELIAGEGPGQDLLVAQVGPLMGAVGDWIEANAGDRLRPGVSVRAVLWTVVSDVLLRSASSSLREPLWGPPSADRGWSAFRAALLRDGEVR